jgi:hypothetical protein
VFVAEAARPGADEVAPPTGVAVPPQAVAGARHAARPRQQQAREHDDG